MRPVTIREVAQRAGVGLGTVSRVLNGSPSVHADTRRRVQQVIEDLHYVPNPNARRLSSGKTLTVAVIAPFFTRPAFIERLRGIQNALAESEYDLNLYSVETVERRDRCMREAPRRERADGVIILSLPPRDSDVPPLALAEVPIVLVDANHISLASLSRVIVDDVLGGIRAMQHLIELGHHRIGYICDWLDNPFNFTSSRDRFCGYRKALEGAGIEYSPEYFAQGEHSRLGARILAENLLRLPSPPTAIFAASDTQAMGVLEAARNAGVRVPEDLSVIGYDDIEISEYLGLTTVRQPLYESGRRGVDLLLSILEDPQSQAEPVCEVLPTELVVRATTAPPPCP